MRQWLFGVLGAACILGGSAWADTWVIRSVPVVQQEMPKTSAGLLQILEEPNLLRHMEAIRQAKLSLPATEQAQFFEAVKKRKLALEEDPVRFFDLGYTDLVLNGNKTGLFYLRKANDRLKQPATSLAYAMAQADIERFEENVAPEKMSMRKLDVSYKLQDAVAIDSRSHQPGFWPAFAGAVQAIKQFGGQYEGLLDRDYSEIYVPYGNRTQHYQPRPVRVSAVPQSAPVVTGCHLTQASYQPTQVTFSRSLDLLGNGQLQKVLFFKQQNDQYRVLVTNPHAEDLGSFESKVAPHIVEDLENDGVYELVVRQYQLDPLQPLKVYRFNQCAFRLDDKIDAFFQ
jgi:hypothetical protein